MPSPQPKSLSLRVSRRGPAKTNDVKLGRGGSHYGGCSCPLLHLTMDALPSAADIFSWLTKWKGQDEPTMTM